MAARTRTKKNTSVDTLQLNAQAWFDAVCDRRSRRLFEPVPVEEPAAEQLAELCKGFRPYPDARVEFVKYPHVDLFRGILGSYGKVIGAQDLMVVIAGQGRIAQAHAGYVGEAAILEATRLGLGTCWVGGFFDKSGARHVVDLGEGESIVAITPVGYALDTVAATSEHTGEGRKRKPIHSIAQGLDETWPAWARAAVECARLAPSAVNRQPWRFRMSAGKLILAPSHVPSISRIDKALDCGIAMLHAELGARACDVAGHWIDADDGATDIGCFELL